MKTNPAILLLCALCYPAPRLQAQVNLVPNPSFEQYDSCPNNLGEIYKANGWSECSGSPDYFNACGDVGIQVPNNGFGYQAAASGNAYAGFITYWNGGLAREVLCDSLITSLNVSQKYFISFKVSRADDATSVGYSTNRIGAKLTTVNSYPVSINNQAHVFNNVVITDTTSWVRITGFFIADSVYKYLMIGNFFDDANTTVINDGSGIYAYYYLDDVCLSTDSLFCANYSSSVDENTLCNQFSLYPNPANDFVTIQNYFNAPFDVTVYNSISQLLYTKQNVNSGNLQLDIGQYSKGLLFIKITSQNNQNIYKILKQ